MNETHLSTERTQTGQDPWIPEADVYQGRTCGDPVAPGEGTPTAVGVIVGLPSARRGSTGVGPIRARQTFEALRHGGSRGRFGPLTVSFLKQPSWSKAEVAYAINRRVGSAVERNRLRRRLRAIVSEQSASLPAGAYVVSTGPGGSSMEFDELKVAMNRALEKATGGPSGHSPATGDHEHGAS
jgi:ribonuclease P protein component